MTKPSHSTETDTPASTTRLGRRGMLQISAAASGVAASMPLASPTRAAVDAEIASEKSSTQTAATNKDSLIEFSKTPDRVFISGNTWANPMEDWQLESGRAVCMSGGAKRNLHSLIHEVDQNGDLHLAVDIQRVQKRKFDQVGFRVGIQSDIKDYRANCFTHRGLDAGIVGNDAAAGKKLFIGPKSIDVDVSLDQPLRLDLQASVGDAESLVTLKLLQASGDVVGEVQHRVAGSRLLGNVALVQHFGRGDAKFGAGSFAFGDWTLAGSAISVRPERAFGPLLWTMYTLSDSRSPDGMMLNLTALTGPLGQQDSREIELEFQRDGKWVRHGVAELDPDAFTATFRIANWDATTSIPFRCVFRQRDREGNHAETFYREGTIRAEPKDRPLRLGALTCQNDYAFPYAPVADNLVKVDPDLLYFSGDQLYEGHGGYGIIRRPADRAILNYLRKFYQFGWAFGHAMADRPTLCIPDDHDVFQGNIWGEGGRAMEVSKGGASSKGGYIEPAKMVNVVHRTNTSHHPAPFDPQPCQQDISVYYGTLLWGGVSFAILGDRQWKSGPERVETGSGRADHVIDPDFDTSVLDQPGLDLLGERQEAFLKHWSRDWDGHTMKVLLSQTVFAGVATHHGGYNGYLKGDLDSGSWPQSARNRAVGIIRQAKCLHVNGDQHLASLTQYGWKQQRDSNWSFCTPAIAAGYPRWWRPDECGMQHTDRPAHGIPHTGKYTDGFGNLVYVYAHGNPEIGTKKNRYEKAHQKGSGFGLVTIDTDSLTYRIDAFRFFCDPLQPGPQARFPGWPITLHRDENLGQNRIG